MTSPEHSLVGIHLALALRCHRVWGWPIIAMAGIASNVPDWDGLPMLIDMSRFESGHRVWGHSIFTILPAALILAWTQTKFRWLEAFARSIVGWLPQDASLVETPVAAPWTVWFVVALIAQLVHLPCDIVVSGGHGLTDWHVQPFWPVSPAGFALPLIPWGDIGPTVILMAGIIAVAKLPQRTAPISSGTLVALILYCLARGLMRGVLL